MATLNFPDAPDTGDIYFDSNSGFTYEWNGTVWISRGPSTVDNIKELDNISGSFNGSTTTFNLTSSSVAVSPATAQQLVINIGNVLQNPGDDYTVSGSTITFTTAPTAGLVFQGTVLGNAFSLGTVVDGTVSPSSLDTSDSYNVGGITVTGITTVTDFSFSGITTVANLEPADMNISGIGTVSNIIMTKDAAGLGATMGAAVGVVTYFGDGSNLTGLGVTFFPISYDPGISSTNIPTGTNITLNWNHPIKAGSGTITIRQGSASGTVVDQFVVSTSSSITFANNQLTLNPAVDLSTGLEYFVTLPAGTIKSYGDKYQNDQLIYSFTSKPQTMWIWGNNISGTLGLNQAGGPPWPSPSSQSSPTQLPGTSWKIGYASAGSGMAVRTNGTLWTWGRNDKGQLGLNSIGSPSANGISSPTQVGTDTTWGQQLNHINVNTATRVIKTDGTLWTWGHNYYGALGLNGTQSGINGVDHSSPVQVGTDTTWSDISGCSYSSSFALKTDGTFWSWGYNNNGELGFHAGPGPGASRSSPVQVGTETTWSKVAYYYGNSMGLKTDGTIWAWGKNNEGGLGLNDTIQRSSPTQIPGTWSNISSGAYNNNNQALAQKSDGTLWVWGTNDRGFLGQNQAPAGLVAVSSPTQIPGTTWDVVQMAQKKIIATKTDGTLWSWGYNNNGGAGVNSNVQNSSPTQVGTDTNWIASSFRGGRNATIIMRS